MHTRVGQRSPQLSHAIRSHGATLKLKDVIITVVKLTLKPKHWAVALAARRGVCETHSQSANAVSLTLKGGDHASRTWRTPVVPVARKTSANERRGSPRTRREPRNASRPIRNRFNQTNEILAPRVSHQGLLCREPPPFCFV